MSDTDFPGQRLEHPDFWLLSQIALDGDAQADGGQSVREHIARIIHPDSAFYMGITRAIIARGRKRFRTAETAMGSAWIDGFVFGAEFQVKKQREDAEDRFDAWWDGFGASEEDDDIRAVAYRTWMAALGITSGDSPDSL